MGDFETLLGRQEVPAPPSAVLAHQLTLEALDPLEEQIILLLRQERQRRGGMTAAVRDRLSLLSPRECEVLDLIQGGASVPAMATVLGVSESSIKSYVTGILTKLDLQTRPQIQAALAGFEPITEARAAAFARHRSKRSA